MEDKSRVVLIHCDTYETEPVRAAVKKGLELLGGARKFAQPDEKILIKPNSTGGRPAS